MKFPLKPGAWLHRHPKVTLLPTSPYRLGASSMSRGLLQMGMRYVKHVDGYVWTLRFCGIGERQYVAQRYDTGDEIALRNIAEVRVFFAGGLQAVQPATP